MRRKTEWEKETGRQVSCPKDAGSRPRKWHKTYAKPAQVATWGRKGSWSRMRNFFSGGKAAEEAEMQRRNRANRPVWLGKTHVPWKIAELATAGSRTKIYLNRRRNGLREAIKTQWVGMGAFVGARKVRNSECSPRRMFWKKIHVRGKPDVPIGWNANFRRKRVIKR